MTDLNFERESGYLPGYSIRRLTLRDDSQVQNFLETCNDFLILENGIPSQPGDGAAFLIDLPPGKTQDDKFAFAIEKDDRIIGLIDLVRDYPTKNIWWIGLRLIHPDFRGYGLGKQVIQMLCHSLPKHGAKEIRLGVLEENTSGYHFWVTSGFSLLESKPDREFGKKIHTVLVMQQLLSQ